MRAITTAVLTAGALTLGACGGSWRATPPTPLDGNGVAGSEGAHVVTAQELHASNGSVLRAIMGKVPNMKVNFVGLDRCPAVTLRRAKEIHGNNFPLVYLDGTRANNTCILESVPAYDLDRVEIYPMGFTTRPGYATHPQGLILLFSRLAGE